MQHIKCNNVAVFCDDDDDDDDDDSNTNTDCDIKDGGEDRENTKLA